MGDAGDLIRRAAQVEQRDVEFDLDNFITDFEQGFNRFEKINPNFKSHNWGQEFGNRPRIKELNEEADAQTVEGYRLIEFFPERDNKEESYLLFGTPLELQTQMVLLMNIHLMFRNKTLGEWIGYPAAEYARMIPQDYISARILLLNNDRGDQNRRGLGYKSQRQITIPEIDRTKLTYAALRKACGGDTGLQWGNCSSRAMMAMPDKKGPYHQMVAGGDSKKQATANLDRFLQFSRCQVKNRSDNEQSYATGTRATDPYKAQKQRFKVFAGYLVIFNARLVDNPQPATRGKPTNMGKQFKTKIKLPLYYKKEPPGWSAALNEILKRAA